MAVFPLTIVTPDGECFQGDAQRIVARGIDGDVCILARHTNYVTAIATGEVRVTIEDTVRRAACSGGMLTVLGGKVQLVATTFEWEDVIDKERAERAKSHAEELMQSAKDENELRIAKAKLSRALTRIHIAK